MANPGYKGKVVKGSTIILGMAEWSYSGETANMEAMNRFGDQYIRQENTTLEGGEITVSGDFVVGDAGLALIQAAFDAGTHLTDLYLYINAVDYFAPDPTTVLEDSTVEASYITITKPPTAVTQGASGIARVEFSAKVSGALKLMDASEEIIITTLGRSADRPSDVIFIAQLISVGGESDVDISFQYGDEEGLLESETEVIASVSDLGIIAFRQSDIVVSPIWYRAKAVSANDATDIVYGKILSDAITLS